MNRSTIAVAFGATAVAAMAACGDSSGPGGLPDVVGTYAATWEAGERDGRTFSSCTGEVRISSQIKRDISGTYQRNPAPGTCSEATGLVEGQVHETFLTLTFTHLDGGYEDFGIGEACVYSASEDIPLLGNASGNGINAESSITAQCPNPVSLETMIVEVRFSGVRR